MKNTRLFLLLFTLSFISYSQERPPELQKKLDSLWGVWKDNVQPDSSRVKAFDEFIYEGYTYSKPDSAYIFAKELYEFSKLKEYSKGKLIALNLLGSSSYLMGDIEKALESWEEGLKISEKLGDKENISAFSGNMAVVYRAQGDYLKALEFSQKGLTIAEEMGDSETIQISLNSIGHIYSQLTNYPKALEYYQRSLKLSEELQSMEGIASSLNSIGVIYQSQNNLSKALEYFERGLKLSEKENNKFLSANFLTNISNTYFLKNDYAKALNYSQRSLEIAEETGNPSLITGALTTISGIYFKQNEPSKSLESSQRCLDLSEQVENKEGMAISLVNIGNSYRELGDYKFSIINCKKSLEIAKELGTIDLQQSGCECLFKTYKKVNNDKDALDYYEQMIVLKDSIYNQDNTRKITQLEMQYDFDKKEAVTKAEQEKKDALAAQKLKRQKLLRNGFIGGFAVVLLFAGVFFSQRNRISKEKDRSESLLLNILPAEVAEELKEKGEAEAQDFEMVSILFSDFKGFTGISEKLSAKDLVGNINECFKAFDGIMQKYSIEKIKTIGDAYMAAGGLPVKTNDSVKNTVLAALEMQDFIIKLHSEKEAKGEHAFQMRVGIHTGPVVAGIVGVKKFQYDIWGDTVNTASRMESSGEIGKVNISEATYNYIKGEPEFIFESRGKIQAKGKGEVEMYFVSLA